MKPTHRVLLVTALLLLCAVVVSASGPFEHYLVYENDSYAFRLEYPENWSVEESDWRHRDYPPEVMSYRVRLAAPCGESITVSIWENEEHLALSDWFRMYQIPHLTDVGAVPSLPNGSIAGVDAIVVLDHEAPGVPPSVATVLEKEGRAFRIDYAFTADGCAWPAYQHVLSSLEFGPFATVDRIPQVEVDSILRPGNVSAQETECCGLSDPNGNPYSCYEYGNCVWYANYVRPDLQDTSLGSGYEWDDSISSSPDLRELYSVGDTPEIGAIAVFERDYGHGVNPSAGHVAYVTDVAGDRFKVEEMNLSNRQKECRVFTNWYSNTASVSFIYAGVTLFEHADFKGNWIRLTENTADLYNVPFGTNGTVMVGDKTSSIYVPPAWDAQFFRHQEYSGGYLQLYDGIIRDLASRTLTDGSPANDSISSVRLAHYACLLPPSGTGLLQSGDDASGSDGGCVPRPDPWPAVRSTDQCMVVSSYGLPDQALVSPSQSLQKIWRVRNSGTSTWDGYRLKFIDGDRMNGPLEVGIPTTAPGETRDISINLIAPAQLGAHRGDWQIVRPDGTWVPGGNLWVVIDVESQSSDIVLTADPPSPSDTDMVHVYARVQWWPQFRSMQFLIDGTPHEMVNFQTSGGNAEISFDWDTSSVSLGDHSIVVEVADQTDTSWSRPQRRAMVYTLEGNTGSRNHAPNRPILVANPAYDWYVTIGNAPQLCAQAQGDPDGDAVTQYRFVASASVGTVDSGWVSSSCHAFGAITPGTYEWHAQVRDSLGGTSDWSDNWHFTTEPTGVDAYIDHFSPGPPSNAEEVKIYACSSGHAGVNITLRVMVNDANDGTDSGEWHIIKELGVPCFNDVDVPVWRTLEHADGPHLVRVVAMAVQPDAGDTHDEVYTLNHRRPDSTRLIAPVPPSRDYRDPVYLNSRTVTFQWQPTIRANSYTLHVGTSPSPRDDPSPVYRQLFDPSVTQHTVTFAQDYPVLYWQVEAANDVGSNTSTDQLFGIDRADPACAVEPLPAITPESVFQVSWEGSDNLAGVRTVDLQYLDTERGAWSDWMTGVRVTTTTGLFTGQPGHSYAFRCRATDAAANTGDYPATADTATRIDPTERPPTPWWDSAYAEKRNLIVLNNAPATSLPVGYPVHLHFDGTTSPTAAELYAASQSATKCDDLRVVYSDTTELHRLVQRCSGGAIDIWFRNQVEIPASSSDGSAHQLYYGNTFAGAPPADPNQVWYPYLEADTTYLYYLQEGSGAVAHDASGNGRDCTIDPSVQWAASKFGNGIRLNRANLGDSRSLNCGSAIPLSAFTVEFWYKPDADDGGRIAGELAGGGNGGGGSNWLVQNFEGRIRFDTWECPTCGSQEVRSNFNLRDAAYVGKWNHIAVTFNGGNEVNFYINGAIDSAKYLQDSGINTFTPPLEIGSAEGISQIKANIGTFRISSGVKTSFPYGTFGAITSEPTVGAGASIEPPASGHADLAVLRLGVYPNPDGGVLVEAVLQNQGELSTENGFFTDLYLNHVPSGGGDYTGSVRLWVNDPITSGATITLTTVITDLGELGGMGTQALSPAKEVSGTLYAQVDSAASVGEPDEVNNIYASGTEVCVASADAYEDDDAPAAAPWIELGGLQSHNIDRPGDEDWVRFAAKAGTTYVLSTSDLGVSADTYLYVYDTDGASLLAANDDYGGSLASLIEWTAPADGTYHALVKHWNPNVGGCGTGYTLAVVHKVLASHLPLVLKQYVTGAPTPTPTPSPTPSPAPTLELVGQIGGATYPAAASGSYAYVGVGPRLVILDVSNPADPVRVGQTGVLPSVVDGVAVAGNYAYVADGDGGLRIIEVSEPRVPREAGFHNTPGGARGVAVAGDYAYVASGDGGLRIIDISDPAAPSEVGFCDTPGYAYSVAVAGDYAYVASADGRLCIIDISDPAAPSEVGFCDLPGSARDVAVGGSYAYVVDYSRLSVVDVSDPTAPVEVGFYDMSVHWGAWRVSVVGSYAYVADYDGGLSVVDVSNPATPVKVGFCDVPGGAGGVAIAGHYAYVAAYDGGLSVVDVSNPAAPVEVAFCDMLGLVYGVAVAGNYAYVADGPGGLSVVDISDPAAPVKVGFYDTPGHRGIWSVAIAGHYAYVVDHDDGLRVVDISDPAAPVEVGFCDIPGGAGGVAVAGSYAYITDDYGLRVVDVSDPTAPVEVSFWAGYSEYAYGVAVTGNYAYVARYSHGLRVVDVSDPTAPVEVGSYDTPGAAYDVAIDGYYAYVADYEDGLRVVDVLDPATPMEVGFYDTLGLAEGVAVTGGYAYIADYSGLSVVDVSDPRAPVEVGFYDTPGWTGDVTLAGGYVFIADGPGGLLILRYTGGEVSYSLGRRDGEWR